MTRATQGLIEELSLIIDKNKYLLLSGGTAVGKTYLSTAIAARCADPCYNNQGGLTNGRDHYEVITEIIPIHPTLTYEDVVSGITINTDEGKARFQYVDKVFLNIVKAANASWRESDNKKYFIILDDIGRGAISGVLGDMLPLIEPHGKSPYTVSVRDGGSISITPNLYIIATKSTVVDSANSSDYAFLRHFYERVIESDYRYMSDSSTTAFSDYDISANALFYRSYRIVTDYLKHRYQISSGERNRFVIGHGIFKTEGTSLLTKYQVLPLIRQYVKEGVLDRTALPSISSLQKLVDGDYTKDASLADVNRIRISKTGVTAATFLAEGLTHQPIVNLVSRIKEQGLIDDTDIATTILFNPQVLIRKKAKLDKVERAFSPPGYLYVDKRNRDLYTYGTTVDGHGRPKRPRFFYSGSQGDALSIDGIDYAVASEMQPGEYTRWYEELNSGQGENERYSSSPNSIMFRILRSYYSSLDKHYSEYLTQYPGDENISKLKAFAAQEYLFLVEGSRRLHPEISDEKVVNAKANDDFRELISKLTLFWKNKGEIISVGGQAITVEGVYKVDITEKYEQFSKAMETLGIHQMIMQGPPGTSKTYSAREYLRFVAAGIDNQDFVSNDLLDAYQISDYMGTGPMCSWCASNPGQAPQIAWDIVQFHPSYGYEDFVRGIEVSTVHSGDGQASYISYDTVNKVLGRIADLASKEEFKETRFFLVIDEINRANLATVFGELIYGLEYRGKSVATPYTVDGSNKVLLPDNLYLLGTMNTADKSIGGIDYAIRRRFLFFSLLPDKEVIIKYGLTDGMTAEAETSQNTINLKAARLFDKIAELFNSSNLNTEYYRDDVQIGHTYFLVKSEDQLFLRFKYQILPILREYYKDGMFQFEQPDGDNDGWQGLIDCVTGEIDINSDSNRVKEIFEKLTEEV